MNHVIVLLALLSVSIAGCGGGGSDCAAAAKGYQTCFSTGADDIQRLCEIEEEYGCVREEYWDCHADMNCPDQDCASEECLAEMEEYQQCIASAPPCE